MKVFLKVLTLLLIESKTSSPYPPAQSFFLKINITDMNLLLIYVLDYLAGIEVGDELVIDGGMAGFEVIEKIGSDLRCKCTDPGLLLPRAKFSFWRDGKLVQRNYGLPTLSAKVLNFPMLLFLRHWFRELVNVSFIFISATLALHQLPD
jgi:hypothetical protein